MATETRNGSFGEKQKILDHIYQLITGNNVFHEPIFRQNPEFHLYLKLYCSGISLSSHLLGPLRFGRPNRSTSEHTRRRALSLHSIQLLVFIEDPSAPIFFSTLLYPGERKKKIEGSKKSPIFFKITTNSPALPWHSPLKPST